MAGRLRTARVQVKALSAIERGKVFVGGAEQTVADAARRLQKGETVRLWMDRPGSAERRYAERRESGLHLLYEDSSLLVINKPAGALTVPLPSQPDEVSLLDQLKHHLRSHKVDAAGRPPHRPRHVGHRRFREDSRSAAKLERPVRAEERRARLPGSRLRAPEAGEGDVA